MSVRDELEVTIKSDPRLSQDRNAALVALCRLLADQVDEAGDKASSRLTASYLSALKDLGRAMATDSKPEGAGGKLAQLRAVNGNAEKPAKRRAG